MFLGWDFMLDEVDVVWVEVIVMVDVIYRIFLWWCCVLMRYCLVLFVFWWCCVVKLVVVLV